MTAPSQVALGDHFSLRTTQQRQNFYAKGLHWQIFCAGLYTYYATSPDGVTWNLPIFLIDQSDWTSDYGDFVTVHFDGYYVHFSINDYRNKLWYRKGIPESDGSITFLTDWQQIPEITVYSCDSTLALDSEGYPWIAYYNSDYWIPHVIKSKLKDGKWLTDNGFPKPISNMNYHNSYVVPLLNKQMYVLHALAWMEAQGMPGIYTPIYGRLWDGTSFSPDNPISSNTLERFDFHQFSAVAYGGNIYLAFNSHETNEIVFMERKVSWSSQVAIVQAVKESAPVVSLDRTTGDVYVFWAEGFQTPNGRIYYMVRKNGVWSSRILFAEAPNIDYGQLSVSEFAYDRVISVAWTSITGNPYAVENPIYYKPLVTTVRPAFGKTTTTGTEYAASGDTVFGTRFYLSEPGKVTELFAYVKKWGNSIDEIVLARGAIYSDDAGRAHQLLAVTEERQLSNVFEWISLPLQTPVSLNPGYYWLAVLFGPRVYIDAMYVASSGGTHQHWHDILYLEGFPEFIGEPFSVHNAEQAIYGVYTPVGAATGTLEVHAYT